MGNLAIRKEKNLKNKIIQAPYEQNISRLKKQKKTWFLHTSGKVRNTKWQR